MLWYGNHAEICTDECYLTSYVFMLAPDVYWQKTVSASFFLQAKCKIHRKISVFHYLELVAIMFGPIIHVEI